MCDAELFNVLVGRVVRESREGISRGFSQSGPAEHCGDPLSTGKGHGNHPLTDPVPGLPCTRSVPYPQEPGHGAKASRLHGGCWPGTLVV